MVLWLSRICEEFHCLPSAALREWLTAPVGLIEEVMEARAYAYAKARVDAKDAPKGGPPDTPMMERVTAIELAIVAEELASGG